MLSANIALSLSVIWLTKNNKHGEIVRLTTNICLVVPHSYSVQASGSVHRCVVIQMCRLHKQFGTDCSVAEVVVVRRTGL